MSQTSPISARGQSGSERRPTHLFATANDLPRETRVPVVQQLNQSLADTTDLATQMKVAHWNVKGIHFYQLHLLFDEIAELLQGHADVLAERATSLGGQANGTVRTAASESTIPELPGRAVTGEEFLEATVDHLAAHAANLRAAIDYAAGRGDEDTADLYTELSREVDQQLYFLESHLQTEPVDVLEGPGATRSDGAPGYTGGPGFERAPQQATAPPQGTPQRTTYRGPTQGFQEQSPPVQQGGSRQRGPPASRPRPGPY